MVPVHEAAVGLLDLRVGRGAVHTKHFVGLLQARRVRAAGGGFAKAALGPEHCFQLRKLHPADVELTADRPQHAALAPVQRVLGQRNLHEQLHEQAAQLGLVARIAPDLAQHRVQRESRLLAAGEPVHRRLRLRRIETQPVHELSRLANLFFGYAPVRFREESHSAKQRADIRPRQAVETPCSQAAGISRVTAVELVTEHEARERAPRPRGEARHRAHDFSPIRRTAHSFHAGREIHRFC